MFLQVLAVEPWSKVADYLVGQGVLGIGVLALGWALWQMMRRERDRAEELDRRYQALIDSYQRDVIPALTRSLDTNKEIAGMMPGLIAALGSRRS